MCVNDKLYEEECIRYIQKLNVPEGYEVEQLSIWDAPSMAAGYNEGMRQSDAKYKVYLHQDVFVVYQNFIYELLKIFSQDSKIGMIGMVGSPVLPAPGPAGRRRPSAPDSPLFPEALQWLSQSPGRRLLPVRIRSYLLSPFPVVSGYPFFLTGHRGIFLQLSYNLKSFSLTGL